MYLISNDHRDTIINLLSELEKLPTKDIRTTNVKRMARIVDIIGDIGGEKIGISKQDNKTMYEIGDHVVIEDFDYSDEECSTGYHFFFTQKQAEEY